MENWGLMTFRREFIVYDENFVTAFTKEQIMNIIAHELAHLVRNKGCWWLQGMTLCRMVFQNFAILDGKLLEPIK